MAETDVKPLHWHPEPGIGYSVTRRPDGGMNVVFSDISKRTLEHWRNFSMEHLLDSDRLTRNLYDLRNINEISDQAINYAVEVNNDPSVRNIRLAVVVSNPKVMEGVKRIEALTIHGGVEMAIFEDMDSAEDWLARPLTLLT
jgi:hypothetical protein